MGIYKSISPLLLSWVNFNNVVACLLCGFVLFVAHLHHMRFAAHTATPSLHSMTIVVPTGTAFVLIKQLWNAAAVGFPLNAPSEGQVLYYSAGAYKRTLSEQEFGIVVAAKYGPSVQST